MSKSKPVDILAKARAHARVAALNSKIRGIAPSDAGVCFIAEGLVLLYGIELPRALELLKQLLPHAYGILQCQLLNIPQRLADK
jgi:hypothetical protein